MIQKFWTTKDGKIGTAHKNRNDEVVDFRPFEVASMYSDGEITLWPSKGQDIERLNLPVVEVSEWKKRSEDWQTREFFAEFEEVRVSVKQESTTPEYAYKQAAFFQVKESRKKEFFEYVKEFEAWCLKISAKEFFEVVKLTHKELGQLQSPKKDKNHRMKIVLLKRAFMTLFYKPPTFPGRWDQCCETGLVNSYKPPTCREYLNGKKDIFWPVDRTC